MRKATNKPKTRKDYSAEFKAEAVRLVTSGERRQVEVSRSLGIASATISKWCREQEAEASGPKITDESAEIKRLEAEVRRLKLEQEILKKAAAYFARNQM